MSTQLVIGLSATRGTGKDTLFQAIHAVQPIATRYSFGDVLRGDLAPLLQDCFNINVWQMTPDEKELVRPIMIAYGMAQRARDPDYLIKRVVDEINADLSWGYPIINVISDLRFINEAKRLRASYPGFRLIYLERDGAPPPTDEEEKHYRQVGALADLRMRWGNDSEEKRLEWARWVLERLRRGAV